MKIEISEATWLDENLDVSLAELVELSGLPEATLRELVDGGVLVPNNPAEIPWTFSGNCVVTVRTVARLRDDFDLDPNALALALSFLDRIRELEAQLRDVRAQLPPTG